MVNGRRFPSRGVDCGCRGAAVILECTGASVFRDEGGALVKAIKTVSSISIIPDSTS